jgi:hypothetical protein
LEDTETNVNDMTEESTESGKVGNVEVSEAKESSPLLAVTVLMTVAGACLYSILMHKEYQKYQKAEEERKRIEDGETSTEDEDLQTENSPVTEMESQLTAEPAIPVAETEVVPEPTLNSLDSDAMPSEVLNSAKSEAKMGMSSGTKTQDLSSHASQDLPSLPLP